MSLLTRFLAVYHRSGMRGSYRLTNFLAHRLRSLQSLPIKTEGGTVFIDLRISSAHGILAYPNSQSGENAVMRRFVNKDDVVFDIGAHFGFYTTLLSELAGHSGKVVAFEPNPELLPSLRKTVQLLTNVELYDCALSDNEGSMNLYIPEDASMASLSDWTNGIGGKVHQAVCEMHRLDDMVEKGEIGLPQFIKCDVEGAELAVFRGGIKTLDRTDAPVILFEVNAKAAGAFGWRTSEYFDVLESLERPRYSFFEVTADGLRDLRSKDIEYTNVVAVPEAKIDLCQNILTKP